MRQFSSGSKINDLIEAFRNVPQELRSAVSKLVTDPIYWHDAGGSKTYHLSNGVEVHYEFTQDEHRIEFKKGNTAFHCTKIKKWPDNWHDEEVGRDKMKM